ncbi:MAG: helix-turn-helix transcriptional regulator [Solibacillus sp.]
MRVWLKNIREEKGLTQENVASMVGISRSTYGHIESGERGVTVSNAKKIASALNFKWTLFFEK